MDVYSLYLGLRHWPLPLLGTPVVPFCPFYLGVSLFKPNSRKKGTLIIKGFLGNLVWSARNEGMDPYSDGFRVKGLGFRD